jgi:hypothetical protein
MPGTLCERPGLTSGRSFSCAMRVRTERPVATQGRLRSRCPAG